MGRTRFYEEFQRAFPEEFQRAFPECKRSKLRDRNFGTNPVWVLQNIELQAECSDR
jgi:hypothetical protein